MSDLLNITLATGRVVHLDRLIIEDTYLEVEGGTPEDRRLMLLDIPYERVVAISGDDTPFLMLEPPPGDLPALTFIAQLSSDQPVAGGRTIGTERGDEASELTICWYADKLPADVLAYVTAQLQGVNWDTHAGNFEW